MPERQDPKCPICKLRMRPTKSKLERMIEFRCPNCGRLNTAPNPDFDGTAEFTLARKDEVELEPIPFQADKSER